MLISDITELFQPFRSASACAFTTTERKLPGIAPTPAHTWLKKFSSLTCYGLRFVELTAGDQPSADMGFTKAICPLLPTNESTISYAACSATRLRYLFCNALIGGRPLLITPGQCAELIDEESEDLTGVWLLGYCQELLIVCIYLCGQFVKSPQSRQRDEN
ncbi:hypothetical protein ACKS2O_002496 [Cronobacter dublinensis]